MDHEGQEAVFKAGQGHIRQKEPQEREPGGVKGFAGLWELKGSPLAKIQGAERTRGDLKQVGDVLAFEFRGNHLIAVWRMDLKESFLNAGRCVETLLLWSMEERMRSRLKTVEMEKKQTV